MTRRQIVTLALAVIYCIGGAALVSWIDSVPLGCVFVAGGFVVGVILAVVFD